VPAAKAQDQLPTVPDEVMLALVLDPNQMIAQVGDKPIFSADLLPAVDQMLEQHVSQIPKYQLDQQRAMFVQQMLPRKIELKLVLLDFLRTIPADKRKDVLARIKKQVEKQYYEEQAPKAMEKLGVHSLTEFDHKLRSFGSSIRQHKDEFREQVIAQTLISQKINRNPEITHDQLLDYYHAHRSDYDVPARAKWEKLTAKLDEYPNRASAERAIVDMGNQVLRGADFAAVARRLSQGSNADQGGYHDWTSEGALLSKVLDQAIFSLPLNRLSRILQDQQGYHIVRVIERQRAYRISFLDAQDKIREKLQEEDRKRQVREYLEGLRQVTYVWTIFDPATDKRQAWLQR
jgi:hypothetical protein